MSRCRSGGGLKVWCVVSCGTRDEEARQVASAPRNLGEVVKGPGGGLGLSAYLHVAAACSSSQPTKWPESVAEKGEKTTLNNQMRKFGAKIEFGSAKFWRVHCWVREEITNLELGSGRLADLLSRSRVHNITSRKVQAQTRQHPYCLAVPHASKPCQSLAFCISARGLGSACESQS